MKRVGCCAVGYRCLSSGLHQLCGEGPAGSPGACDAAHREACGCGNHDGRGRAAALPMSSAPRIIFCGNEMRGAVPCLSLLRPSRGRPNQSAWECHAVADNASAWELAKGLRSSHQHSCVKPGGHAFGPLCCFGSGAAVSFTSSGGVAGCLALPLSSEMFTGCWLGNGPIKIGEGQKGTCSGQCTPCMATFPPVCAAFHYQCRCLTVLC